MFVQTSAVPLSTVQNTPSRHLNVFLSVDLSEPFVSFRFTLALFVKLRRKPSLFELTALKTSRQRDDLIVRPGLFLVGQSRQIDRP